MSETGDQYQTIDVKAERLEVFQLQQSWRIPEHVARDYGGLHRLQIDRDVFTGDYIMRIRSKFAGKRYDVELEPVPLSWWDHFKRDAIPTITRWLKLTVRTRTEVLSAWQIFPSLSHLPSDRLYYHESRTTKSVQKLREESENV